MAFRSLNGEREIKDGNVDRDIQKENKEYGLNGNSVLLRVKRTSFLCLFLFLPKKHEGALHKDVTVRLKNILLFLRF